MAGHFNKTKILAESSVSTERTVVKLETSNEAKVRDFDFSELKSRGIENYEQTRKKYGSFAATDVRDVSQKAKDKKFSISPLLRQALAVENEEQRSIEERVQNRILAVQHEARTKAHAEGFAEGQRQGHLEALKKFQQEGQERLKQFDQFLNYCETAKREIFEANEKFFIEIIYQIASMVCLKEVKEDESYLSKLGSTLLDSLGARESIFIKINEDDFKNVEMLRHDLKKSLGELKNLNIESSPDVHLGGMVVETQWNFIDASIKTQLDNIAKALLERKDNK